MLKEPKPKKLSEVAKLRRAYREKFLPWKEQNREVLALPLPTNLANSRMHWRTKDLARQEYFSQCDALASSGLLPLPETNYGIIPNRVEISSVLYTARVHDWDNLTSRQKWAIDWLNRNGYMVDDNPEHCELLMPKQMKAGKLTGPPRIEFVVKPVEQL